LSTLNKLYNLPEDQVDPASKVCGRAHQDDPVSIYCFPDQSERKNKLRYFFELVLRYGLLYGEVYITSPNLEGIVTWLPFWESEITIERQERCGLRETLSKLGREPVKRWIPIEKYYYSLHKQRVNYPHCYLANIAVDPIYQGKGFASTLLRVKLAEIDEQKLPCYLETFNEKNVPFYQHFGFEVDEEGIIPDTNIPFWAMLRKIK
jgi:ribosomal protein S18 acetylase RimI-like enzyme